MTPKTYLLINLHAHLPFLSHSKNDIEENWFFEAVIETYIPLIRMMESLCEDSIRPGLTFSISATLGAMLENDILEKKLKKYAQNRLALCEKELEICKDEKIVSVINVYQGLYESAIETIEKYSGDLITPLKRFQHNSQIEILTTSATHCVLPLLPGEELINAQLLAACEEYKDRFNRDPLGFWLPECAYSFGLQKNLKLTNLKYFFLEDHAKEKDFSGVFSAGKSKDGLVCFFRDASMSRQVWSSDFGYPGNGFYREFYRDIGYDRDKDYISVYTGTEFKIPTGLKYYRITSKNTDLSAKDIYDYEKAMKTVDDDAADFLKKVMEKGASMAENGNPKPLVVTCFDAELFGHWWFEGPEFLEAILRKIRNERLPVQVITPSEYLSLASIPEILEPEVSSWGEKGYFEPWLNPSNDYMSVDLYEASLKMVKMADRHKNQNLSHLTLRALNQLSREILLAQSSDWAFMVYTGPHGDYAKNRFFSHLSNAKKLMKEITDKNIDEKSLIELEKENNVFPRMDFRFFCSNASF